MQLTGWGCGGSRKINRLAELPLPAADAQSLSFREYGKSNNEEFNET